MKKRCWAYSALAVFLAAAGFAQTAPGTVAKDKQIDLPLPLVSPGAYQPGTLVEPLSPKGKASRMFRNTFYPRALANRLLLASYDQLFDRPEEWPSGGEGFGMRMGNRMGSTFTRNSIQLAADLALRPNPGMTSAIVQGSVPRRDMRGGGLFFSKRITEVKSFLYPTLAVRLRRHGSHRMPDRLNTTGRKFQQGTTQLALRGAGNMLREFWPDIARKLRLPERFRK